MKDIAIFGAGGFGREVACLIKRINDAGGDWNFIGFFDDTKTVGESISHYGEILGDISALNRWDKPLSIIIALGSPLSIKKVTSKIINPNIDYPNLIDPSFIIDDPETFWLGRGNIIQGGCSASCNTKIGDFNVLNGSVAMGHDAQIGNYNVVMSGVRVSGNVMIENENLIGVGSIIIQHIKIGNNVCLGAGAVLLTKPKNGNTYIGNPAKLFKF